MRGAERPTKVRWTRPFLPPLGPLSDHAALQLFTDIADDIHDPNEVNQLLQVTDNLPLAVDLVAHLVDSVGCSDALCRWKTARTTSVSRGYDRRSNLDISINISLTSPRIISVLGALDLLKLLSILPDGLDGNQLQQMGFPHNVLACRAVLISTSLAFVDEALRIRVLVPIQEHLQHFHPVGIPLLRPVQRSLFHGLIDLYTKYRGSQDAKGIGREIQRNARNLKHLALLGLNPENPDLQHHIQFTLSCIQYLAMPRYERSKIMEQVSEVLSAHPNSKLQVQYVIQELSFRSNLAPPPVSLIHGALEELQYLNDPKLASTLYYTIASYHCRNNQDNFKEAIIWCQRAAVTAKEAGEINEWADALCLIANINWHRCEYAAGNISSKEAQRLAKISGHLNVEAESLIESAQCSLGLGNYTQAVSQVQRARQLLLLCGSDGALYLSSLMIEGEIYWLKSEYVQAKAIFTKVTLDTTQQAYHADVALIMAEIDVEMGNGESDVEMNLAVAQAYFKDVGFSLGMHHSRATTAALQLREHEFTEARVGLEACMQVSWLQHMELLLYAVERLGDTQRWDSVDFTWASRYTVIYLVLSNKHQSKLNLHKALRRMGDVLLAHGDEADAETLFHVALEGFTLMDVHQSRAECMVRLGDLAVKAGNMRRAESFWKDAEILFERSSQSAAVTEVRTKLARLDPELDKVPFIVHTHANQVEAA
ncbi:hypothetical protein FB45DRAFT_874482 [Roridomyces roridus]|uniref:Uncharacterized protein n=1 Tax=Roridomyces roridus TaxID=1738132 RepID=A0AAD7FB98_9AGAR|nr:hypothetical protein FB45DRAFT_874482 [Roridomyces roridus]